MIFSRIFSFSILYVVSGMLDQACHTPDILPCTCQADYTIHPSAPKMRVDCSRANTSKEIFSALNNFSITQLWEFRVTNNKKLQELPEGIFGHLSLENIYLNNTGVRTIHPSVILSSKDRLVNMTIEYSPLEEFPFHLLSSLPRLTKLRLPHNSLTSVPAVRTDSLETLNLEYNNISIMEEVGWATPNLRKLSLSGNPISTLPSAMIKNQKKLEEFSCSKCKLGPILSNGQLEFHSKALKDVYLKMNDISRLEPGAITGITSGTRVYLSSNKIAKLDAKSFHGILHVLSQGDGTLALSDNPIRCGCELEWLVRDPELLRKIHGSCENGTVLKALGRDSFKDCRTCPYECVDAQSKSLCAPETVNTSRADDCLPEESCCRLEMPGTALTSSAKSTCPIGFKCVNVDFIAMCDLCSVSLSLSCPSAKQVCCWIPERPPCPSTHSCLHSSVKDLCEKESEIPGATCDGNRVCCMMKAVTETNSTLPPCDRECVAVGDISTCVSDTLKYRTQCSERNEYCCQTEENSTKLTSLLPKSNVSHCEPHFGTCMAPYLSHDCRSSGQRDLSVYFKCPGNLECCALKTDIERKPEHVNAAFSPTQLFSSLHLFYLILGIISFFHIL